MLLTISMPSLKSDSSKLLVKMEFVHAYYSCKSSWTSPADGNHV